MTSRAARPVVLVAALVALVGVLAACGGSGGRVSLAELVEETDRHDGADVVIRGTVVEYGADDENVRHHVIVTDETDLNRVELLPMDAALEHVGELVEVEGTFTFDPERGRAVEVERIEPVR